MLLLLLWMCLLGVSASTNKVFYLSQKVLPHTDAVNHNLEKYFIWTEVLKVQSATSNNQSHDPLPIKSSNTPAQIQGIRFSDSTIYDDGNGRIRKVMDVLSVIGGVENILKGECYRFVCRHKSEVCVNLLSETGSSTCTNLASIAQSALVIPHLILTSSGFEQRNILALVNGNSIKFYHENDSNLVSDEASISFDVGVQKVEFLQHFDIYSLASKKVLAVSVKSGSIHLVKIDIDLNTGALKLGDIEQWQAKGVQTVFEAGGQILSGEVLNNTLFIQQLKKQNGKLKSSPIGSLSLEDHKFWQVSSSGGKPLLFLFTDKKVQIYDLSRLSISLKQTLQSYSEMYQSAHTVKLPEGEALVIRTSMGVKLYLFDNRSNLFILQSDLQITAKNLWGFKEYGSVNLVIETPTGFEVKKIEAIHQTELDKSKIRVSNILNKINKLEAEEDSQNSLLKDISKRISRSIGKSNDVNGNIVIDGKPEFKKPISTQAAVGTVDDEAFWLYQQELKDINERIAHIKLAIHAISRKIKECVPLSGSHRPINGEKYFFGVKSSLKNLFAKSSYISPSEEEQNQSAIVDILINLIRRNDARQVKGRKSFTGRVTVDNLWTISLGNVKTSNLVIEDEFKELRDLTFANKLTIKEDLNVKNYFNGLDLSEDVVLLKGKSSLGRCKFDTIGANRGTWITSHLVNGINFTEEAQSLLRTSKKTILPGSVIFGNLSVAGDLKARDVMGVDIDRFHSDAVHKIPEVSRNSVLDHIYFLSTVKCEDITVKGSINGDSFPSDFVHKSPAVFFGTKYFDKSAYFDTINVNGFVDKLKVSDIVTKSTPQKINTLKTFYSSFKVIGNLDIHSAILDGVDLELLHQKHENSLNSSQTLVFEENLVVNNLTVKGKINGLDIDELAGDFIYKDEPLSVISSEKTFLESLKAKNIFIKEGINGIDLKKLIKTNEQVTIDSVKIFKDNVFFNDMNVHGPINHTEINSLFENSLYIDKPNQVIQGRKSVIDLKANIFDVENFNQLDFDKFITKSTDQNFTGNFEILRGSCGYLDSKLIRVLDGKLNNVDLRRYEKQLSLPTSLDDNILVHGNLYTKNMQAVVMNDIKVEELLDLIQKNEPTTIAGQVIFDFLEIRGPVTTNGKILKSVAESAVNLTGTNVFENAQFGSIQANDITVGGFVNGFNLATMEADAVYLDQDLISVKGTKSFKNSFHVHGDLNSPKINKKNLRSNLLSRTAAQIVTAPYTFENILVNNAQIDKFNGIELDVLKDIKRRKEMVINDAFFTMRGSVRVNTLEVDGLIDGHDVTAKFTDAVRRDEEIIKVKGRKFFDHFSAQKLHSNYVNQVDVDSILASFNQTLDEDISELVVHGKISAPKIISNSLDLSKDSFDTLTHLEENFKGLRDAATSDLIFQDLFVNGNIQTATLNSVAPEKYLNRNTNQTISHSASLRTARVHNLNLEGQIGGVYPSTLVHDKNNSESRKIYPYSPSFAKGLHLSGDLFVQGVFGTSKMNVPQHVIQLRKKGQIVQGKLKVTSPLTLKTLKSSSNILNGVDLVTVNDSFHSIKEMMQNQYGIVDTHNPSEAQFQRYLESWRLKYRHECQRLSQLHLILSKSLSLPTHLNLVYQHTFENEEPNILPEHLPFGSEELFDSPTLIFEAFSKIWFVISSSNESCTASLYSWDKIQQRFSLSFSLGGVGNVHQWFALEYKGVITLLAISQGSNCSVGSPFWRMTSAQQRPMRLQELRPARRAFIEEDTEGRHKIYLNSAIETFVYQYKGGHVSKLGTAERNLDFLKKFEGVDGSKIVVRIWNQTYTEIITDNAEISFEGFPYSHGITAIVEDGEVVLMTSGTIVMSKRKLHYIYVLKLHDDFFHLASSIAIESPAKLFSFSVSRRGFAHHFVVVLQAHATPFIYKLQDMSTLEKWAELPYILKENPWVHVFNHSSGGNEDPIYLVLGDNRKALVTQLIWNSKSNSIETSCQFD